MAVPNGLGVPAESNWEKVDFPAAVAIIDSGIWCPHPDLKVVSNTSFIGLDACEDYHGHGTNVAGVWQQLPVHTSVHASQMLLPPNG